MMREHKWMSLDDVLRAIPAMAAEEISQVARGVQHSDQTKEGFLEAYMAAEGSPKKMRKRDTGYKSHPWSQRRRQFLSRHLAQISQGTEKLWDEKGEPTRRHLALVAWAYTPQPKKLRKWLHTQPSLDDGVWLQGVGDIPSKLSRKYAKENPQDLPLISLDASPVIPQDMPYRDWYRAEHLDWCYHTDLSEGGLVGQDELFQTVDPCLQELVGLLVEEGFATTPSCQAHYDDLQNLPQKYVRIKLDEMQVQGSGLPVLNVSTGEEFLWKDPEYHFPFSEDEFIALMSQPTIGYLGVLMPEEKAKSVVDATYPENVLVEAVDEISTDDGPMVMVEIRVDRKSLEDECETWVEITEIMEEALP
tara:strand:+ start:2295 stop:3377 length:1083 start_codon:yes stop_codon:yes gene_type:complete